MQGRHEVMGSVVLDGNEVAVEGPRVVTIAVEGLKARTVITPIVITLAGHKVPIVRVGPPMRVFLLVTLAIERDTVFPTIMLERANFSPLTMLVGLANVRMPRGFNGARPEVFHS